MKCFKCKKHFSADEPLIIVKGYNHHYHIDCYKENAMVYSNKKDNILYPDYTQALDGYSGLNSNHKKIVNQKMFPNLKPIGIRYQIKMDTNIEDLNSDQLILGLQQRDINIFPKMEINVCLQINEGNCRKRLKQFLENQQCKDKQKLLVYGFCNEISRKTKGKVHMPVYLIDIVGTYSKLT